MMKRVMLAVFLLLLAGCGSGDSGSASATSGASGISDTAATAPVTAATASPPTGTGSANGTSPTGTGQQAAPCTAAAMTGVVRAALSAGPEGTVDIAECRNGFARVYYRPKATNVETEQLFLADADGVWTVLTYGTGIDCADDDLRPAGLEEACVALGLRPASPGGGGALTIDWLNAEVTNQAASSPLGTSTAFDCILEHGNVDTGSVFTCRPDPEPTEGQFPLLVVLILDGGAGRGPL